VSSTQQKPSPDPGLVNQIIEISRGYMAATCLYTAAKLRIADYVGDGAKPVSEIARASKTNEDGLYRIMRALATISVFRETAPRIFCNTPLSEALRSDVPGSSRDAVLFMVDAMHLKVYGEIEYSVATGEPVFTKITGLKPFEFFHKNDEDNKVFNAAMTSISGQAIRHVMAVYDFGESGTLADIGAGHGALLSAILAKHGGLRGIAFDLPNVIEGAKPAIEAHGLAGRCEIIGGDFFKAVPAADSYVMKSIIHDWDDERAVTILKNCARAMRSPNGKVILIEMPVGPANEPGLAKWLDIEMLAIAGGRERTEQEYAELLAKAGLRMTRVARTAAPTAVIEAVKA
jgi:precorrin-6B methylase 2